MGLTCVWAMRTADRGRRRNYLGRTVRALLAHGFDPAVLHLFPTDPDVAWMGMELAGIPAGVRVHAPATRYTPNGNGLRQITVLDHDREADWIGLLEDDLDCTRTGPSQWLHWLEAHADPEVEVYRLFALPGSPLRRRAGTAAAWTPLCEMKGSQAVFLRRASAQQIAAWAAAHPTNWRPTHAPFQDRPDRGFDKLIGYAALSLWPVQRQGLVAMPMLVNHIGRESLLHSHGVSNDAAFVKVS